ncbi:hypothetical protein SELMODRAFT_413225 [Selaginella moellendorffii]|uniref:Uncharacterized protein n=1 Tax=Selaginella moellendorffii TaxID=88036 RepID=D8RNR6_SELML|nr:hypothetical protein SELMODRAFT_413225 [Selaginella moellendorffii]
MGTVLESFYGVLDFALWRMDYRIKRLLRYACKEARLRPINAVTALAPKPLVFFEGQIEELSYEGYAEPNLTYNNFRHWTLTGVPDLDAIRQEVKQQRQYYHYYQRYPPWPTFVEHAKSLICHPWPSNPILGPGAIELCDQFASWAEMDLFGRVEDEELHARLLLDARMLVHKWPEFVMIHLTPFHLLVDPDKLEGEDVAVPSENYFSEDCEDYVRALREAKQVAANGGFLGSDFYWPPSGALDLFNFEVGHLESLVESYRLGLRTQQSQRIQPR